MSVLTDLILNGGVGPFSADVFENLGLGWQDILFHTVNLLILIVALRFLLYKPMRRIIDNHKAKLNDMFEQSKKLSDEAEQAKLKYEKLMEDARQEAVKIGLQAAESAKRKSEETVDEAKRKAQNIIDEAKREVSAERERFKNDFRESVSHLAVDIAEKILEREISEEDNRKIIDECLRQWEQE